MKTERRLISIISIKISLSEIDNHLQTIYKRIYSMTDGNKTRGNKVTVKSLNYY